MFALCANNKLSRVSNIIILSLGRVQEGEPSASFGSEILSVRIAPLHQRIIKFRRLPALRFAAVAQCRKTITELECPE